MLEICIFLSFVITIQARMEGFIVGGNRADINKYPHSAFVTVSCFTESSTFDNWVCGASILNQKILLTAGHCLFFCLNIGTQLIINLGNDHRQRGIMRSGSSYIVHEKYDPYSNNGDIAVVKMSMPVKFTSTINRVAIMRKPPYREPANIGGWGDTDEHNHTQAFNLLEIDQNLWNRQSCERLFSIMPKGTICASSKKRRSYPASGDSGAALLVRGYIQIGLVSFKVPGLAVNVIVYTDVGYHYEWIKYHARRLHCSI